MTLREQAAPQQRASSLHSVCTVLACGFLAEIIRKHCLIKKISYDKKKEEEACCFPRKEDAAAMDDAAGTHDSREGWFDVVAKHAAGCADLQTAAGAWQGGLLLHLHEGER